MFFQEQSSLLNAGQIFCNVFDLLPLRLLLLLFFSIFEWLFYTGFTVLKNHLPDLVIAIPQGILNCPLPFPFLPNFRTSLEFSDWFFDSSSSDPDVTKRRRRYIVPIH